MRAASAASGVRVAMSSCPRPFSARTAGLPVTVQSVRGSGDPDGLCRAQLVEYGEKLVDPLAGNVSQVLA
jgi:hypothetical protein